MHDPMTWRSFVSNLPSSYIPSFSSHHPPIPNGLSVLLSSRFVSSLFMRNTCNFNICITQTLIHFFLLHIIIEMKLKYIFWFVGLQITCKTLEFELNIKVEKEYFWWGLAISSTNKY